MGLHLIPTKDFRKVNQWLTKDLEKPGMRWHSSQEAPEEAMKDCWEYLPDRHWAEVIAKRSRKLTGGMAFPQPELWTKRV